LLHITRLNTQHGTRTTNPAVGTANRKVSFDDR